MKQPRAFVLGGSGFVGRYLVRRLSELGYRSVLPTRRPERHRDLRLYGDLELVRLEGTEPETLAKHLSGCDLAVNLVGILNESGQTRFDKVHVDLAVAMRDACLSAGVPRLLHMSALNADAEQGSSAYLRSKGKGEQQVLEAREGLSVTSFRPSVIFGRGDSFFNRFAQLLELAPGIMPLACPDARFAPVWVGDVVEAMVRSIADPATHGRGYDLCGPAEFRLEELVEYTAHCIGRRLMLAGLNDRASRLQARIFELIPGKPFTRDNYLSMQTPSVCQGHNGLLELGIHPTAIETVVPGYLSPKPVAADPVG